MLYIYDPACQVALPDDFIISNLSQQFTLLHDFKRASLISSLLCLMSTLGQL
jgi:hypothetical protein